MQTKNEVRYEDAAELRENISGWVCKTCRRFWGDDEHMSRWCCANDLPCKCGGRNTDKGYTCCRSCRDILETERFYKRTEAKWDGKSWLYSEWLCRYFDSPEDAIDYLSGHDMEGHTLEDLRLVICDRVKPRYFEVEEWLSDDLRTDDDYAEIDGASRLDALVNRYLEKHFPELWEPGEFRLKGGA